MVKWTQRSGSTASPVKVQQYACQEIENHDGFKMGQ
jgi:hypothetical protein